MNIIGSLSLDKLTNNFKIKKDKHWKIKMSQKKAIKE